MLKDKTKKISLLDNLDNPFKKLHGHTKIELTSVIDGSKKVVEHDNTFQVGVLADYMRSLGWFNNNPYANGTWTGNAAWRNLVGGILLFRDAIDNSNGEVKFMPPDNAMVANSCYGVSNSGAPVELGSYNSLESVVGTDTATLVYDWGTSQGNGTIGCVCLTSETGGYIGYGNESGVQASRRSIMTNQTSSLVSANQGDYRPNVIIDNVCYGFYVDSTRTKIIVVKCHVPVSESSIFERRNKTTEIDVSSIMPWSWYSGRTYFQDAEKGLDGKIYLFPQGTSEYGYEIGNGADIKFFRYDPSNDHVDLMSVRNNTGRSLRIRGWNGPTRCDGTYLFVGTAGGSYTTDTPIYCIRISDGTVMGSFSNIYPNGYFHVNENMVMISESSSSMILWDVVNDKKLVTNGSRSGSYGREDFDEGCIDNQGYVNQTYGHQYYKNPLYLATINNLATPVTKDNTQTMKVTYTLTEVDE